MDFFNDYTSFYFYSTLFQGNMALLGLGGVFVVYRLQVLSTAMAAHDSNLVRIAESLFGGVLPKIVSDALVNVPSFVSTIHEYVSEWESANPNASWSEISQLRRLIEDTRVRQILKMRELDLGSKSRIRGEYRFPFLSILLLTFCSLALIPFCSYIHHCSFLLEAFLFAIITLAEGLALWQTKALTFILLE
jgi:hypothetical protein